MNLGYLVSFALILNMVLENNCVIENLFQLVTVYKEMIQLLSCLFCLCTKQTATCMPVACNNDIIITITHTLV